MPRSVLSMLLFALTFAAACAPATRAPQAIDPDLRLQVARYQTDPAIVDFIAREATRAGVRSIRPFPEGATRFRGIPVASTYGMTTEAGDVYINPNLRGGTSVVNLTHEIAHVAASGRNCQCHGKEWLNAYLDIAKRFEAQFPGVAWSGTTPTQRVLRNVERYGIRYP